MSRYSITVLGKSPSDIDYKFCAGGNFNSDEQAKMYANDIMLERMRRLFIGNWWIEKIHNDDDGTIV